MKSKEEWKKDYLQQTGRMSYKDYVAQSGSAEELEKTRTDADSEYARASSTYGTRASSLLKRGLSGSGYSDYLDSVAYTAKRDRIDGAEREKTKRDQSGYASYLASLDKQAEDAYSSHKESLSDAFQLLIKQGITDKGAAVSYLTTLGLDEETASLLAEKSNEVIHASGDRRGAILSFALNTQMRFERAYSYALANGIPESVAREIASISQAARDALFGNEETYKFDISRYEYLFKNQERKSK